MFNASATPRAPAIYVGKPGHLRWEEDSRVGEDGVLLADLTFDCLIVMLVVCFWYQMKGLSLSYNLMLIFKKWLKIRYPRAKIKTRKGLNPHPVHLLSRN